MRCYLSASIQAGYTQPFPPEYKIYTRILNKKLKRYFETFQYEIQFGFRKGQSCIDSAFTLKVILLKRR
jgi:hypothetical protein